MHYNKAKQLDLSIHLHNISVMKTTTLQIRLQPSEKRAFEEAANLAGISLSSWVRERLRLAAIRELERAGKPIPFVATIPLGVSSDV